MIYQWDSIIKMHRWIKNEKIRPILYRKKKGRADRLFLLLCPTNVTFCLFMNQLWISWIYSLIEIIYQILFQINSWGLILKILQRLWKYYFSWNEAISLGLMIIICRTAALDLTVVWLFSFLNGFFGGVFVETFKKFH